MVIETSRLQLLFCIETCGAFATSKYLNRINLKCEQSAWEIGEINNDSWLLNCYAKDTFLVADDVKDIILEHNQSAETLQKTFHG